jgi:hypothetical protein
MSASRRLIAGFCSLMLPATAFALSTGAAVAVAAAERPAVPLCGVADPALVGAPATAPPSNPVRVGPTGFTASSLIAANSQLHLLDASAATIHRFSLEGTPTGITTIPFRVSGTTMAVDETGNVYVGQYPATLVKLSPNGATVWSRNGVVAQEVDGVFGMGTGTGFRVGVIGRGEAGAVLLDANGTAAGRNDVTGVAFSPAPDGGLVATDGAYVRRYDSGGRLVSTFGDARTGNDPSPTGGPFHFYQLGGAVVLADGTTYVADATRGIAAASPEGFYRGMVSDEALGYLTERSSLAFSGDRIYFTAGGRFNANQNISWISLADLATLARWPKAPANVLGYGAGVETGVTGNYFGPGRAPTLTARFDPWWVRHASQLRLAYAVRDRLQVLAASPLNHTVVALPTTTAGLAGIGLALPPARPGAYEVDVRLVDGSGAVVGATCVTYTVGASGQRLDFATLPPGADYGGPAPARGVALADVLGTGSFRAALDWSKLLPDPNGPMRFEAYDVPFAEAAREAAARQVSFHVQVGAGGPIEKALVQNGTWGARVGELVGHFRGTVQVWEAWNEPNITFGTADAYVNQILRPFTAAVRVAAPGVRVIGGSLVGVDVGYYDAIGRAGGFALMDVVAIHPYSGHNRSWEEQGTPAAIRQLREVLNTHGAGTKPLWDTESAWWADGPGNFLAQADKVARAMLWMRALGVERWNYFMMEGGYGDYGFSYSLIQSAAQPDDYVKPAALATMTAAGQTRGRAFGALVDTGIPQTYAASFGARLGGSDTVLAAWTADLPVIANLVAEGGAGPVSVTATDVLGAASTMMLAPGTAVPLALSGSPVYLTAPAGVQLRLGAPETFGVNLAGAAAGARAAASSAISTNPPAGAIDGVSDAANRGDLPGLSAWASAPGDGAPALTVTLAQPTQINRVLVSTHSIGSIVPGLRSYDVAVQDQAGAWTTVGQVSDQFFSRQQLLSFAPRTATAVRLNVRAVDYGGLAGGMKPWFWAIDAARLADASAPWYGPAAVYDLQVFAPGGAAGTEAAVPAVPTDLTAPGVSSSQINTKWTGSAEASSYKVERSTDNRTYSAVGTTKETSYADLGLSAGTTYYYRVRATNAAGDSAPSNIASATTTGATTATTLPATTTTTVATTTSTVPATTTTTIGAAITLAAPTGLTANVGPPNRVNLQWTGSAGATAYKVERSTDNLTFAVVGTTKGTSYSDAGLTPWKRYYYRIRATNSTGASPPSNVAVAMTTRR